MRSPAGASVAGRVARGEASWSSRSVDRASAPALAGPKHPGSRPTDTPRRAQDSERGCRISVGVTGVDLQPRVRYFSLTETRRHGDTEHTEKIPERQLVLGASAPLVGASVSNSRCRGTSRCIHKSTTSSSPHTHRDGLDLDNRPTARVRFPSSPCLRALVRDHVSSASNDRTERRRRPTASESKTTVARPRSLQ